MSITPSVKCILLIIISLGIFSGGLQLLYMSMNHSINTLQYKTKDTLFTHLIINYSYDNYPICAKKHIERLNNNYYIYSNYDKSFFTLVDHHNIKMKFFIYTPNNTNFSQCVSIYSEERFQFLSNHPNRVYNI
eukprot:178952_1